MTATADGNGSAQFSFSVPTGPGQAFITATATDTTAADTSEFSNCVATSAGGSLAGSVQPDPQLPGPVDLTAAGSEDWAVWGLGNDTTLSPSDRKAGGGGISDLTNIDPDPSVPLRGLGALGQQVLKFSWTDGTANPAQTGVFAGIQHDGQQALTSTVVGKGFSFTVPADTTPRTLKVYVATNRAAGQLTATLSDGCAPATTSTLSLRDPTCAQRSTRSTTRQVRPTRRLR